MISLQASCTDPTAVPTIIVTPSIVPAFEAIAGRQVTQEITVKSENCTDLTGIDDMQSENTLNGRWTKTLRNGTLLIEQDGVKYNVLGVRML